jgi:polyketide biosynthesis enoyl-CoA hydratase PksH
MRYDTIKVAESPGVLTIVMDCPERQNSITESLLTDMNMALDHAELSSDCKMVIIQGCGGFFSTGMDFVEAACQSPAEQDQLATRGGAEFLCLLKRFASTGLVVVSDVDGRVAGGGVGLAAASDFVFASTRSQFSLPEALWGLLPCCVLPFLIRRAGFQKAYAMTLSTQPVAARQAAEFHLVDEVADDTGPLLRRLMLRIMKLDPHTISAAKRYFGDLWIMSSEMDKAVLAEFNQLMSSDNVRRRISDFVHRGKLPWEA